MCSSREFQEAAQATQAVPPARGRRRLLSAEFILSDRGRIAEAPAHSIRSGGGAGLGGMACASIIAFVGSVVSCVLVSWLLRRNCCEYSSTKVVNL